MSIFNFNHKKSSFLDGIGVDDTTLKRFRQGTHEIIVDMLDNDTLPDKVTQVLEIVEEELDPITPLEYFLIGLEMGEYLKAKEIARKTAEEQARRGLSDILDMIRKNKRKDED